MDSDRFYPDAPADLVCIVCACVPSVNDLAVVTLCDHHGCRACFKAWIAVNSNCPACRGAATIRHLREPSRTTRNILSAWRVACAVDGCKERAPYESLAAHEAACPKRREPCAHCGKLFPAATVVKHEASCACKPTPCEGGCGALLPPAPGAAVDAHDCVAYLKARLEAADDATQHWLMAYTNATALAHARVLPPSVGFYDCVLLCIERFSPHDTDYALFPLNVAREVAHAGGGSKWGAAFGRLLAGLRLAGIAKVDSVESQWAGPPCDDNGSDDDDDDEDSSDDDGGSDQQWFADDEAGREEIDPRDKIAAPDAATNCYSERVVRLSLKLTAPCPGCGRKFGGGAVHVLEAAPPGAEYEMPLRDQLTASGAGSDDCVLVFNRASFGTPLRGNVDAALCRACVCARLHIAL